MPTNGRPSVTPDRLLLDDMAGSPGFLSAILPAGSGTAALYRPPKVMRRDDVVAVDPAMLEGRRDVAGGDRQHPVGQPHVHLRGQVLERLPCLGEDPGHLDAEPLHGMAAEIGLRPAGRDRQRGQHVERGVTEMGSGALQPPDRIRQRRLLVDQPDRDARDEQGEQRHPDRDVEVEQELLQRRVLLDQRRHRVAARPHEDKSQCHDPVNQPRGEVVAFVGHRHAPPVGLRPTNPGCPAQGGTGPCPARPGRRQPAGDRRHLRRTGDSKDRSERCRNPGRRRGRCDDAAGGQHPEDQAHG